MSVSSTVLALGLVKPPEFGNPGVVFIVHWVVCTLAVKLPLLCACAVVDPKRAKAMMARAASVILVNIILSCWFSAPPGKERVFYCWLLGDEHRHLPYQGIRPIFYSRRCPRADVWPVQKL